MILLKAKTRWFVKPVDPLKVEQLVNELKVAPLVAKLLLNRGIDTKEKALSFIQCTDDFHDPFLLDHMDLCVNRIERAVKNNERIIVYGDYDADGVTSTVVMLRALHEFGAQNVDFYIPNRFTEGYGPNERAFRTFKEAGYDLIITVDNGISGIHEAQVAKEIGIDLIITDHHEPGDVIPEAIAVIHPKLKNSAYPFKELAGVGVAFKVAQALLKRNPVELLPFVAIGTIADLVPLEDENRLIAKRGIEQIRTTLEKGIRALAQVSGLKLEEMDEESIGFSLAPRINAPGRLDSAMPVVELFMSTDDEEAEFLATEISSYNVERQEIVNSMTEAAIQMVTEQQLKYDHPVIIVGHSSWNPGVIGIVASRLVEKFYRPVFVFSYDEESGLAKGSARSIPGFNLYENLTQCKDILPHFGGHPMAAGMTLRISDIPKLQLTLNQLAKLQLKPEDFIPITELDVSIPLSEITVEAIEQVQLLAPFGVRNPKPRVMIEDIHFSQMKKVGTDQKHLKVTFQDEDHQLDGIGFNLGEISDHISSLSKVSVIGELGINEWNNIRKPQIFIKDLAVSQWQLFDYRGNKKLLTWIDKLPEENCVFIVFSMENYKQLMNLGRSQNFILIDSDQIASEVNLDDQNVVLIDFPPTKNRLVSLIKGKKIQRIYAYFYQNDTQFFKTFPSREQFKWLYTFLVKKGVFDFQRYSHDLAQYRGLSLDTIEFMLQVFLELEFVTMENGIVSVNKQVQKRDLSESITYARRQELIQLEKELLYSSYQQLKEWFQTYLKHHSEEERVLWI